MKGLGLIVILSVLLYLTAGQQPLKCGLHEVVNECPPCKGEPTCEIPNPTPKPDTACAAACFPRCECDTKNGWIRFCAKGPCVRRQTCRGCLQNEVVNECASQCVGEPTCQNPNPTQEPGTACTLQCVKRCECDAKNGWIRSSPNGPCVQKTACTAEECGPNKVINECASNCIDEPTCQNPNPTEKPGTVCNKMCVRRCECDANNGWILATSKGPCVKKSSCQSKKCQKNEQLACAPCCPDPTCQDLNPTCPSTKCPKDCPVLICRCVNGFLRDNETGKCIPEEKCRPRKP